MRYKLKSALPESSIGQEIRSYTRSVYKEVYNASISPSPDEFIYVEADGEIYASFGITYRENKKLFSECYLDKPLDHESHPGGNLVRCEVGSCVAIQKGFGLQLYKLLPYILYEKNACYALVTLTNKVQAIFHRLRYQIVYLKDASEDRVPENTWGSFYATHPKTFIFNVSQSLTEVSLEDHAQSLGISIIDVGRTLEQRILLRPCAGASFNTRTVFPTHTSSIGI